MKSFAELYANVLCNLGIIKWLTDHLTFKTGRKLRIVFHHVWTIVEWSWSHAQKIGTCLAVVITSTNQYYIFYNAFIVFFINILIIHIILYIEKPSKRDQIYIYSCDLCLLANPSTSSVFFTRAIIQYHFLISSYSGSIISQSWESLTLTI